MPNCAVYSCRNTSGRTGNKEKAIYFHQFPKREQSPKRYAKWLKFCKRKTFVPKKSSRICSKHFKSSDFDESQVLKIRLMPHAKLKGPTLKPGAIPTPIDSNTKRKSSSEAQNEEKERKILVDKILQNASAMVRPTALKPGGIHSSIDSNAKRKSSCGVLNEEKKKKLKGRKQMLQNAGSIRQIASKLDALPLPIGACMKVTRKSSHEVHSQTKRRKVEGNEMSIRIKEVQKVEGLKTSNENLKSEVSDVLNKGIKCELGIESYRNIVFAPSLKSESCSSINLVQSSVILKENIKLETDETLHLLKMSLCPWIRTPLTDLTGSLINNQWRSECSAQELKVLDCYEAYGLDKGAEKCLTLFKDFQECVGKRKQLERVAIMKAERIRQVRKGENTYAPGPVPHVY